MPSLEARLMRVEQQRGAADQRHATVQADAAFVIDHIQSLAAASRGVSVNDADRARWAAWSEKFAASLRDRAA